MAADLKLYIHIPGERATDSGDGLTWNLLHTDVETSPAPEVWANNVLIPATDYTVNYVSGTITFSVSKAGSTVLVEYTWLYTATYQTELSVFEFEKEMNIRPIKDVNGRDILIESYSIVGNWTGALTWEYQCQTFFEIIRGICEIPWCTFDLVRTSLSTPYNRINNLRPVKYPKFSEMPGIPGTTHCMIEVHQVST